MRQLRLLIGTLVTVGFLAALWVSPASAQPGFNPPGLDRAIEAQERHTDNLLRIQGVVGTAVGLADGGPVVKIFTEHAGVTGLPRTLDGVTVEVQVTGKIFALHHRPGHSGGPGGGGEEEPATTNRWPVPIGISTGNEGECSAGTIGARVTDGTNVYALSNNHVYALGNAAPIGSNVLQPGLYDTNCAIDPNDVIGTLADFELIVFSTTANNTIDAAIAEIALQDFDRNGVFELAVGNATPSDGYGAPKTDTISASVGQAVQKYGRTTQLTKGTITGTNAILNVGYSSGTARFVGQIIVQSGKPFIKSGDSGSLLVVDGGEHDLKPVGLLFAGNRSGKLAVANQIDLVLGAFVVSIDGEE